MTKKMMIVLGLAIGPVALLLADVIFSRTSPGEAFEGFFSVLRATGIVAWPVGVLVGHWYYPGSRNPVVPRPYNYYVLGGLSALIMGLSLLFLAAPGATNIVASLTFVGGVVAGVLLWSIGDPGAVQERSAALRRSARMLG
jgi:hypothetical protein